MTKNIENSDASRENPKSLEVLKFISAAAWYLGWVGLAILVGFLVYGSVSESPLVYRQKVPMEIRYHDDAKGVAEERNEKAQERDSGSRPFFKFNNRLNSTTPGIESIRGVGQINLDSPGTALIVFSSVSSLIMLGLFLFGVHQTRRVLWAIDSRNPFDPQTPKFLRRIAYTAIVAGPLQGVIDLLTAVSIVDSIKAPGLDVALPFDLRPAWIFGGLLLLLMAYVFEQAVKIKHEQDLTI